LIPFLVLLVLQFAEACELEGQEQDAALKQLAKEEQQQLEEKVGWTDAGCCWSRKWCTIRSMSFSSTCRLLLYEAVANVPTSV
jgi:hypothetical protein